MLETISNIIGGKTSGLGPEWNNPFALLRSKWHEVPSGDQVRSSSLELLEIPGEQLLARWNHARDDSSTGESFDIRGWYHTLYKDVLKGKKVVDVGSGFGIDGITFAEAGAQMTFADIVPDNLEVLKRLCDLRGLQNVKFHYLESFDSIDLLDDDYDVIWCQGSLINAPFDVTKAEIGRLLQHLKIGGRWIELAYPEIRWRREGAMPFEEWGIKTDGGAPWIEWYDLDKLRQAFAPATFDVVLYFDFHNSDFNWFDLQLTSHDNIN